MAHHCLIICGCCTYNCLYPYLFYDGYHTKNLYEYRKNINNGKVQVVPVVNKKDKAIEYKNNEEDDVKTRTDPTSTSRSLVHYPVTFLENRVG